MHSMYHSKTFQPYALAIFKSVGHLLHVAVTLLFLYGGLFVTLLLFEGGLRKNTSDKADLPTFGSQVVHITSYGAITLRLCNVT